MCEDWRERGPTERRAEGFSQGGVRTTMWSERHAMVRRIRSSTGWIGECASSSHRGE